MIIRILQNMWCGVDKHISRYYGVKSNTNNNGQAKLNLLVH